MDFMLKFRKHVNRPDTANIVPPDTVVHQVTLPMFTDRLRIGDVLRSVRGTGTQKQLSFVRARFQVVVDLVMGYMQGAEVTTRFFLR